MKHEIKSRWSGDVIYTAELPDDTQSGMAVRAALEQATRAGADLRGANLSGADLRGADINGETITRVPVQVANLRWDVLITEGYLRIGCQRHTHAEWAAFDDATIAGMDEDAADFWAQWKAPLLVMCAAHALEVAEVA